MDECMNECTRKRLICPWKGDIYIEGGYAYRKYKDL